MRKYCKLLVVLVFFVGIFGGITDYFSPSLKVDENSLLEGHESRKASAGDTSDTGLAPIISAKGAILIDCKDGSVIYEKDADKRLYPASTTKIMTALVALEILEEINGDLQSTLRVPKEAIGVEGSSINLKAEETMTIEELLYGVMLQSGNDGATALAICLGGNLANFVERMNQKASALDCKSTHFTNPTGLFDQKHYTTARDLARISLEAMKKDSFRTMVGAKSWQSADGRQFINKNKTISEYEGATGIKIGYTKKSGRTLVASAKKGEVELIAVVLNDPNWFQDAYAMLDYGFQRL